MGGGNDGFTARGSVGSGDPQDGRFSFLSRTPWL
jgi:hypothetical protein